jgi:hypothetical protein
LSYAIINKNKNIPLTSNTDEYPSLIKETEDWLRNIVLRKHFAVDNQLPKMIYYVFPDREVVKKLKDIFIDVSFDNFIEYYRFCSFNLLECYSANEVELFSYINFFHLIGSFRFFTKEAGNKPIIETELYNILNEEKFHPLIKYSALQITSLNTFEDSQEKGQYSNDKLFNTEYFKIIDSIEKEKTLTNYISFYSIYYYENGYNFKKIVEDHLNKIFINDILDKEKLHTYLPQLTALLIRLNENKFNETKTNNILIDLFESSSIKQEQFNEIKNRIIYDFNINT